MSLEIECGICEEEIRNGENLYCFRCYQKMWNDLDDYGRKNEELLNRIAELETELQNFKKGGRAENDQRRI